MPNMSTKPLKQSKEEALVLHFAKETPLHLGVKKLAKLMYFTDFTAYELQKKSITGDEYKKYNYGPIPVNFYNVLDSLKTKNFINYSSQTAEFVPASIQPLTSPDYSLFSAQEIQLINSVTDKYRNATASELELIAKNEPPYKIVEYNEKIPYHLAFYRNTFGEMELNGDENTL